MSNLPWPLKLSLLESFEHVECTCTNRILGNMRQIKVDKNCPIHGEKNE